MLQTHTIAHNMSHNRLQHHNYLINEISMHSTIKSMPPTNNKVNKLNLKRKKDIQFNTPIIYSM